MPAISVCDTEQDFAPMPIEPSWIRAGHPVARAKVLFRGSDRACWTMLWTCSPGEFDWHYKFDETIHFLDGRVTITAHGGQPQTFGAGDIIYFRKGEVARWRVEQPVRKLAVCHYPAPALVGRPMGLSRKLAFHMRKMLRHIRRALANPGLETQQPRIEPTASRHEA